MTETYVGRNAAGQRVYVEAQITEDRTGVEWQTTDHRTVTGVQRLSVQGIIIRKGGSITRDGDWWSSGQIDTDNLRQIVKPAPGWTVEDLRKLADAWDRWHLNDMRAGCIHQTEIVYRDGRYGREIDLDATTAANDCPAGYRYGSAWLVESVPDDVAAFIAAKFGDQS